jgi:alkylation response protein AidB-like acyl-CoA dehydrogenase
VLVIEEIAKCCGISGRIVVEANMGAIGAIGAIMKYGSEAQKRLAANRPQEQVLTHRVGCHLLDGAGHRVQQEQSEQANRLLLAFLTMSG